MSENNQNSSQDNDDLKIIKDAPYLPLGYDHGDYYYLASGSGQVIKLTAACHNAINLMQLAPLGFWKENFTYDNKVNFSAAANHIFRMQEKIGPYDPARIRGRGPWWHEKRVVIHSGDRIIIGADSGKIQEIKPHEMPGDFIYERTVPIKVVCGSPLKKEEAIKFLDVLQSLSWQRHISAKYVAGWCVSALIGGALTWRPHLWCTGSKGSGKTYCMTQIIRPVLGENCRFFLSSTTEAGIRQTLKRDSLPVMFDEVEGEDQRARDRVQNVLALVRQSSSDTQGTIAKGTPSGDANTYDIRSCFAFSSINASLMQASDQSRVTVCELTKHHMEPMEKLEAKLINLLTKEWIEGFYARAIRLVPVIRKNAKTFGTAVRLVLGEQRAGDQIGTLLAGAYSLESDDVISIDDANKWVKSQDWAETKAEIDGMSDEENLYNFLMQQIIRDGTIERSIGELVDEVCSEEVELDAAGVKSARLLAIHGFKVIPCIGDVKMLAISNTHAAIKKMLEKTPWAIRWGKVLCRLNDAKASDAPVYFGSQGSESRAALVPIKNKSDI